MRQDELIRFGVSMEKELLSRFDLLIGARGYTNRSEAIRDIVREKLVDENLSRPAGRAFGVLTFVYDHHVPQLEKRLTDFQHEHFESIISASHVHIDHDNCLEVIILRGKAVAIRAISDKILTYRGVKHGKLSLTVSK